MFPAFFKCPKVSVLVIHVLFLNSKFTHQYLLCDNGQNSHRQLSSTVSINAITKAFLGEGAGRTPWEEGPVLAGLGRRRACCGALPQPHAQKGLQWPLQSCLAWWSLSHDPPNTDTVCSVPPAYTATQLPLPAHIPTYQVAFCLSSRCQLALAQAPANLSASSEAMTRPPTRFDPQPGEGPPSWALFLSWRKSSPIGVHLRFIYIWCALSIVSLWPRDCSPLGSSVHGVFQQEYWSGLPFPPPGDLPNPGIEPCIGRWILYR